MYRLGFNLVHTSQFFPCKQIASFINTYLLITSVGSDVVDAMADLHSALQIRRTVEEFTEWLRSPQHRIGFSPTRRLSGPSVQAMVVEIMSKLQSPLNTNAMWHGLTSLDLISRFAQDQWLDDGCINAMLSRLATVYGHILALNCDVCREIN